MVKGPSAVLYGQGSPGGLVNQISNMPSADPSHELRLETGSHGRVQAGVRSRGALSEDGVLQYSFSTIGRQSGTRHDDVDERRLGVAPALTWQPTTSIRASWRRPHTVLSDRRPQCGRLLVQQL